MASPNSQTLDFDSLVSTTMRNYLQTSLHDQIFNKLVLFAWLNAKERKKYVDGGEYLVEPLMYGRNTTVSSFSGYDTLDVQPTDGLTVATYNWKGVAGSLVFSLEEKLKNNGKSKIIDLMEAKVTQLEESIQEEMNSQAFGDGTGNGGKDLTGLQAMIGNTGILGGIDSSTYEWWRSYVNSTSTTRSLTHWQRAYNKVSAQGRGRVDLILCGLDDFEWYEQQAYGKLELNNLPSNPLADLGFQTLKYKGATVVYDEMMPATSVANAYFLNSEVLRLRVHRDADFKKTEQKQPTNQLCWLWQVYWFGNLTCGNRRRLGKISNKT